MDGMCMSDYDYGLDDVVIKRITGFDKFTTVPPPPCIIRMKNGRAELSK